MSNVSTASDSRDGMEGAQRDGGMEGASEGLTQMQPKVRGEGWGVRGEGEGWGWRG